MNKIKGGDMGTTLESIFSPEAATSTNEAITRIRALRRMHMHAKSTARCRTCRYLLIEYNVITHVVLNTYALPNITTGCECTK